MAVISGTSTEGAVAALLPTLDAVGYAKVIVAIEKTAPQRLGAGLAQESEHESDRQGAPVVDTAAAMSLQDHFIVPPTTRLALPAAAAAAAAAGGREILAVGTAESAPRMRIFPRLGLALGFVDGRGAQALGGDARVLGIVKAPELSLIRPVASRPARASRQVSWGLERLGVERLWDAGFRGQGVRVGHLDTGVDGTHPALQDAIHLFAQFDDVGEIVPGATAHDSGAHGTHTAGTIAGRSTPKGDFGVAPEAKLVSGMVIEGGQVIDRILAGLEWIIEQKCRVLSMSLGLRGFTPAFQVVVDAVRAAGTLPVFAVGNENADTSRSPGNYADVLSVGATDRSDSVADFSSSQRFDRPVQPLAPLLVAPGVDVLSCVPGGGYAEMSGTSMATPHIAGLAALLFCAEPNATIDQVEAAILSSCLRPAAMPESRGNLGIPDAGRAYEALVGRPLTVAAAASGRQTVSRDPARTARPRTAARKASARKGPAKKGPTKKASAKARAKAAAGAAKKRR